MNFDNNDDFPNDNGDPGIPPHFPLPRFESCRCVTSRILDTDNNRMLMMDDCVLEKTGRTRHSLGTDDLSMCSATASCGEFDEDEDEDDDEEEEEEEDISMDSSSTGTVSIDNEEEEEGETEFAYALIRKIRGAIDGEVWAGRILSRSAHNQCWSLTNKMCAIKRTPLAAVQRQRESGSPEDRERECAAMQYLFNQTSSILMDDYDHNDDNQHFGNEGRGRNPCPLEIMERTNIIMPLDALYDDNYFYLVTPFLSNGDLFELLQTRRQLMEDEARDIIRQILNGLSWFNRVGVSHRDLSLENVMIDDNRRVIIIDVGMCIRIPTRGDRRTLILPQRPSGKEKYISPEILQLTEPFDGHAIDLWAVGVILYWMITGWPPWCRAVQQDEVFRHMSEGGFIGLLNTWAQNSPQFRITPNAMDLLQRMFMRDPTDRLCLNQVLHHPWMNPPPPNYDPVLRR